jgi:hypothetical protein
MFSVKVHNHDGEVLVACCDRDILGKRLSSDDLEISVSPSFYGGKEASAEEAIELLKNASIANIIGDKIVRLALENGLIDQSGVRTVCGTKHAQLVVM